MNRHMRTLCLLLALCLLPRAGAAETAKETPRDLFGTALIDEYQEIRSMAVTEDAAYLLTQTGLYRYRAGMGRRRRSPPSAPCTTRNTAMASGPSPCSRWTGS